MIKLALVGKGSWGKNYIRTIAEIKNCQLPAKYIKTSDYKDLKDYQDIDGVIVATPGSTHYEIGKFFIENGFNILVEKPFTVNYKEALELKKLQRRKNVIVMVGHIYRYHPAFLKLKEILPKIGKIKYILSEGMDYGPVRKDVSALWDWAPHDISMIVDLLGKEPSSVYAWSFAEDKNKLIEMCCLKLKFVEGINAIINVGWLSPVKKRSFTVVSDKGALIFDDTKDRNLTYIKDLGKNSRISYPIYDKTLPLTNEVLEFVDCLKTKRKPKTGIDEGIKIVKIIERLEESIKN